jgi:hypothetical protein
MANLKLIRNTSDQEGLFELAIQLRTYFIRQFGYFQHCNQICLQSVIKIGENILNRKPPRHLKTICDGRNCVFKNSKFTTFRPVIDANVEQTKMK